MDEMISKKAIVFWSGGCDSTLVLHDLIVADDFDLRNPITVFWFDWSALNSDKLMAESKARNKFIAWTKKKGYRNRFEVHKISLNSELVPVDEGLPQAVGWLCMAAPYIPNHANVYIGYHRQDDFWHNYHNFDSALKYLMCVRGADDVTLQYPLQWDTKQEIISRCKQAGIYVFTWWCENPLTRPLRKCGRCGPCLTHKLGLLEAKLRKRS